MPGDEDGAGALLLVAWGALELADPSWVAAALDVDGELAAVLPPLFDDAQAAASRAVPSRMVAMPVRRATWAEGVMVG